GMFLRRTQECKGTLVASNITALVEWGTNIQHPTPDNLNTEHRTLNTNLMAFAIEMAYVPEGPFEVGASGQNPRNRLFAYTGKDVTRTERSFQTDYSDFADNTPPYRITGPGAIPTGRQPGKLWAAGLTPEDGGEIPASFPNGFAAFYCMRDVLSMGQYAAFLNTLTDAQAKKRYYHDGHGPEIARTGAPSNYTYTASAPEEHGVWLSWADGAAYAAWAGLRPMTELEYEKANRSGSDLRNLNVGSLFERQVSIGSAVGRKFAGSHGDGTPVPPEDWPRDLSGVVFRGDLDGSHHGSLAGRNVPLNVQTDHSIHPTPGWRAVRSVPAGDTGVKADPVYRVVTRPLARVAVLDDGVLDEWGKPLVVLSGPDDLFPERFRQPTPKEAGADAASWQGAKDLGATVYLGWSVDALCVDVEVTDDKHFNAYFSQDIGRGDCLTLGLTTPQGRWRIGLALTKTGVAFHQWEGAGDALAKTAGLAVVRDDAGGVTRYELRLPLAALGLEPKQEFSFGADVFDDDDGFGQCYSIHLAGGKFVLAE
ncbi:MAG: SUMF1/EgtB/PvdO family nonheme iron enzyme, partial [Kiritimatiellia bacterium]